jgi:hypothetical protein
MKMMGGVVRSSGQSDLEYDYDGRSEAGRCYHQRGIPARPGGRLLVVAWQIASSGLPCLYCLRYCVSGRGPLCAALAA